MTTKEEKYENFRKLVISEKEKGNVVFMGIEGPMIAPIDQFLSQPIEGILYDLNRLPEVVMTYIHDPKWVNDYAVYVVITELKKRLEAALASQNKQEKPQ